ncbi:MAG: hypothetical protein KDC28_14600 [Saprospiraceae bacterium]|nr:hypothetical protein [Saprospiraceae bacterium]MCB9321826.1 2,4-dihydroxyhept-2-ene-1,7-dioic acid aldolase [Lewinellaceae bacterium]
MAEELLSRLRSVKRNKVYSNAWLTIPSAWTAEIMARSGFDFCTIDVQHGLMDYETGLHMLQAIGNTKALPVIRVHDNAVPNLMKWLDAGALGLILPMIDGPEQLKEALSACYYPPQGNRSHGPTRAAFVTHPDYRHQVSGDLLIFAQIETASGLNQVEAIAAVPGLKGLYVGPYDLSICLGRPKLADLSDPVLWSALERIAAAAQKKELLLGIHTSDTSRIPDLHALGFHIFSTGSDSHLLMDSAKQLDRALRG